MRAVGTMLGLALVASLAGCSAGTDDAAASPSASVTAAAPVATASATASATPSPTPVASPEATSSPVPSASSSPEETDDGDDGVVKDQPSVAPEPTAEGEKGAVAPAITRWGVEDDSFVMAAVVDGVVEDAGTCTLTLTRSAVTRTASGPATRSAASMNCAEDLAIPLADLGSGTWSATVAYESDKYAGNTAAKMVEVP